jgi:hypothetical protein
VDTDSVSPRACVQFSEPLVKNGVDYSSFITLDGAAPKAIEAKGSEICVEGLTHGQRYKIALRAGLPSSVEEPLEKQVNLDIYVRDRTASVRFTGENFVLPGSARRGIPIVSVNADKADLKLYRVGDRNITALLANSQFLTQMDGYNADRIENEIGELVWQGSIDIQPDLNKDVVTSFPVDEALPERKPGIYVLTAVPPGTAPETWDSRATQWFLVSDTGITTYAGTDGLNVFVRALGSAKPLADVDLQLLAKNNEVLGTAKTDADGRAVFSAGLMRGTAAQAPAILTARNGDEDYVFLDMTRAGFDLSDRGVTGRAAPGAIDVASTVPARPCMPQPWPVTLTARQSRTCRSLSFSHALTGWKTGALSATARRLAVMRWICRCRQMPCAAPGHCASIPTRKRLRSAKRAFLSTILCLTAPSLTSRARQNRSIRA